MRGDGTRGLVTRRLAATSVVTPLPEAVGERLRWCSQRKHREVVVRGLDVAAVETVTPV